VNAKRKAEHPVGRLGRKIGGAAWNWNAEEIRNPNAEIRKKTEIRNPNARTRSLPTQLAIRLSNTALKTFRPIAVQFQPFFVVNFGLRSSAFGFLSDFGSRISDFFRLSDFAPSEFPSRAPRAPHSS
jgi:hypothetical protein